MVFFTEEEPVQVNRKISLRTWGFAFLFGHLSDKVTANPGGGADELSAPLEYSNMKDQAASRTQTLLGLAYIC